VKLIVCNAYGCDSITQTVSVLNVGGPIDAVCSPGTSYYCCGMGITNVIFNTINHSSADGSAGYEDFSCNYQTDVIVSSQYTLYVTTGISYYENVRAWIDWNNDGSFTDAELVMASNSVLTNHSATFTIPVTAVANTPLRLRIGDDWNYSAIPSSCVNVTYGQFEDYTVTVVNNLPPQAAFEFVPTVCTGLVSFSDNSIYNPTSWNWDFGDGFSSSLQSPTHTYLASGNYTCTLIVCNANGCDTTSFTVPVDIFTADIAFTGSLYINQPISFVANSPGANFWFWNFGDGNVSSIQAPVHSYTLPGIYIVELIVHNSDGCIINATDTLEILTTMVNEVALNSSMSILPNPFNTDATIVLDLGSSLQVTLTGYDVTGRVVTTFADDVTLPKGRHQFTFNPEVAGVYFVELKTDEGDMVRKVIKVE